VCIKHVDNINNVAWNIRNYRYVGDVSSAHCEAEIIAALASHQAHQAITTGIFGAQDRHRSIAMQRRQDEAIRAARAAMDEDNLNGG
jgi:hypothetical protein